MTWGNQNTEKEGQEQLAYAFDHGVNIFDSAEAVRISPFSFSSPFWPPLFCLWFESPLFRTFVLSSKVGLCVELKGIVYSSRPQWLATCFTAKDFFY
jgi:hypothetical protein